jgi:hypothetical protein
VSAGPYRFVGPATVHVGAQSVQGVRFLRLRNDTGAQVGVERSDLWLDPVTGLPIGLRQYIKVRTPTPFGDSTYTQSGDLTLISLKPHR